MARQKDYESLMQNWPYEYYNTRDGRERKKLLEMSIERGLDPEGDKIRLFVWKKRYPEVPGKADRNNNGLQDTYLKAWMDFSFAADKVKSRFPRNGQLKQIKKDLAVMDPELVAEYGELGEKILYDELYHMVNLYMDLCSEDRAYGSVLFGLGKMKKESFVGKIANEVYSIGYVVPQGLNLAEECRLLTKAATETFYDKFPNYEDALDSLIDG